MMRFTKREFVTSVLEAISRRSRLSFQRGPWMCMKCMNEEDICGWMLSGRESACVAGASSCIWQEALSVAVGW